MRSTKAAQRDIATATTRWLLAFFMIVRVMSCRPGNSRSTDATRFSYQDAKGIFLGNPMNQSDLVSYSLRTCLENGLKNSGILGGVQRKLSIRLFPLHHSSACLTLRIVLCPRRAIPAQALYETKSTKKDLQQDREKFRPDTR